MMDPVLCGIETEYGLWIEGRGPGDQIEDSADLVRSYPNPCFVGWDYRFESPREDMRGFAVERLAVDPEDMKFDAGKTLPPAHILRADRILPNGARFYNDHGHPEYATGEHFSVSAAAAEDLWGESAVLAAAHAYSKATGRQVKVYKNNTDFHGASYGTHESYLVPRSLEFGALFHAVTPMLIARQILTGAGKVGREHGSKCDFQISQRADFFVEPANVETLFRRPVFNTRDEPHADPTWWRRVHVIAGDANRMPQCTQRKLFLVRLALQLAIAGKAPRFAIPDPVRMFESVSKDPTYAFLIELERSGTDAYAMIEAYLAAGEDAGLIAKDEQSIAEECRLLMAQLRTDFTTFSRNVDWAAKKSLVDMYRSEEGLQWDDPALQAVDLGYAEVDPDESLFQALLDTGDIEAFAWIGGVNHSRAYARGLAVERFAENLKSACWRCLTFEVNGQSKTVELWPDTVYPATLGEARNVNEFISLLEAIRPQ